MEDTSKVSIDVEKLEALLPGKRILSVDDLKQFSSFLYRLWYEGKDIPEDFRQKIFNLKEYFNNYLLSNDPGPYLETKPEATERLIKLLPPVR